MMDHAEARAVLDRAKDGQPVAERSIKEALLATGDRRRTWRPEPKPEPLAHDAPELPTPMNVDDDEPSEKRDGPRPR